MSGIGAAFAMMQRERPQPPKEGKPPEEEEEIM